jgi:hypothetical protein
MTNPCLECPHRNVVCTSEQLFMDCNPWNEYEQQMLDKLIDGSIIYVPKPRKKWRWMSDILTSSRTLLGV